MDTSLLIIPAFIAGVLTFLAPCTLPLVPAYLSFISGASAKEIQTQGRARARVFLNGVFYVVGFSAVFILLGSLVGLGGAAFFQYRPILTQVGGVFVILFGLFLFGPALKAVSGGRLDILGLPGFRSLLQERQFSLAGKLKPGNPLSSLAFGGTFAVGWSPCVGPVLAAILTLAASSADIGAGTVLLSVFSAGLAVPFLLVALAIGWASDVLPRLTKYLNWVSVLGGLFLIGLGYLMVTNQFLFWISYAYDLFDFINYETLLDYL